MFERFTEKAIKVIMLAQEEARRLGHNFVGTEQILLGLIFTGMIFYIIYAVSTNKESLEDKKIRTKKEYLQKEKIGKLFPKKK